MKPFRHARDLENAYPSPFDRWRSLPTLGYSQRRLERLRSDLARGRHPGEIRWRDARLRWRDAPRPPPSPSGWRLRNGVPR
jgi:hypothetical protein